MRRYPTSPIMTSFVDTGPLQNEQLQLAPKNPYTMARSIDSWQRKMIIHMICSKNRLTTSQIAKVTQCSERSITNIRKNLRLFGSARSPPVSVGRQPSITPMMLDALCDYLAEKPTLYVEEMAIFLWDEFNILPSLSSIKRALS